MTQEDSLRIRWIFRRRRNRINWRKTSRSPIRGRWMVNSLRNWVGCGDWAKFTRRGRRIERCQIRWRGALLVILVELRSGSWEGRKSRKCPRSGTTGNGGCLSCGLLTGYHQAVKIESISIPFTVHFSHNVLVVVIPETKHWKETNIRSIKKASICSATKTNETRIR